MDPEKVGKFIYTLRTKNSMTQNELANKINVTNKAVSRWERGQGLPDISLLEPLSRNLNISILELLNGQYIEQNENAEKKDINILLETLLEMNVKNNYTKLVTISIFNLFTFILIAIFYFNFRFHGINNSYFFRLLNNLSLIPFSNLYSCIINKNLIGFLQNIIINIFLSILISGYLLTCIKKRKNYIKLILIINFIFEIIKWIFLIGIFDINDIFIRITISLLMFYIYKKRKSKEYLLSKSIM